MYIVYIDNHENQKENMFCTELSTTASSFCNNFNNQIKELYEYYYVNVYNCPPDEYQKFKNKVNKLLKSISITLNKIDLDKLIYMVENNIRFDFEKVKKID